MPARYHTIFKYVGIAAIVLLLAGLLGWYFFLRNQTSNIDDLSAARGFDIAVPSFTGSRSSTAENALAGFGTELLLSTPNGESRPPRLWRVSPTPVAGFGFLPGPTIRYVERSTGHIYDVNPETGGAVRVTKELLPKVYDASIVGTTTVVLRMLDEGGEATTLIGSIGTTTEDGFSNLATSNLGGTIRSLVPSEIISQVVMIAEGADGAAHLVRANADGTNPIQLLTLGVGGFALEWLADGRLFLSELPASGIAGSAYQVIQGALAPILQDVPGLMIAPRSSSGALLYSSDDGSGVRLFARPSADGSAIELSIQTPAEKCVWAPATGAAPSASSSIPTLLAYCASPQEAPGRNFLNSWLRGAIHTADAWFTVDASAGKSERFFIPETSVALDVEHPRIDASGSYIAFMNARDKSLWILRIAE